MTPAFTRSALNKGIQMNEVVTINQLANQAKKYGSLTVTLEVDDVLSVMEQLTATTNSLTNAQEALKSAGIEADTVQAGVMELVSRMNQVVAENALMLADYRDIPEMRRIGAPLTPATEACLNAVRAEGADAAAAKIRKAIPAFKDIHCGAVKECADIAEMVAAQFTTGNAGKDDWIEWGGGERPVRADVQVEVRFRDGKVIPSESACYWNWHRHNSPSDIIAYRVIKDGSHE